MKLNRFILITLLSVIAYTNTAIAQDKLSQACYIDLAKQGDVESQITFGLLLHNPKASRIYDPEHGKVWLQKAAEQGSTEAKKYLNQLENTSSENTQWIETASIEHLKAQAMNGNIGCQTLLGVSYYRGLMGLDKNLDNSIKWFTMAAEQNDVKSQLLLGTIYQKSGARPSPKESVKWLRKAATQGNIDAQGLLSKGNSIVSKQEALDWRYTLATHDTQNLSNSEIDKVAAAQIGLALFYAEGEATNLPLAVAWATSAKELQQKSKLPDAVISSLLIGELQKMMTAEEIEKAKTIDPKTIKP